MRKFSGMLFLFVALCLQVPAEDKQLSLNDFFVKGTFRTEGVYGLRSMNDGEHYTVVEGNGARIVKYSYKTGLPVATLLDLSQIEDCPVKYLNDYTFNADESRILLCTNKKAIYRRSFTADYYIYDFKNKEVKPLSAGGGRLTLGALLRNRVFLCVVIVTMLNGVIRNAVSFWIPTFLSQHLALRPEWVSVASSALPFVNIGGTFLSLWGLRLVRQNEKTMCVLLFVLAAACFGVVWLCPAGLPLLSMAALFTASAAMTGVCNMIFSVYILDFRSTGMISGITGFLDFSSYLSASAASLLFSDMMAQGWNAVILFWIATTALGALVSLLTRLLAGRRSGQPDGEAD